MNLPNIFWNIQKNYYLWSSMNITDFISYLNGSDEYIHHIYSKGGCYRFHILLSKMYKNCVPYISANKNHIITKYRGKFYDIYGEVDNQDGFTKLREDELPMVNKWSFRKNNYLTLGDCPNCDEPLIYKS